MAEKFAGSPQARACLHSQVGDTLPGCRWAKAGKGTSGISETRWESTPRG